MEIIGPVLEKFDKVSEIYEPVDTSFKDNVFITTSFDPQSHFENDTDNVIDIYEKITESKLDLTIEEEGEEEKNKLKVILVNKYNNIRYLLKLMN